MKGDRPKSSPMTLGDMRATDQHMAAETAERYLLGDSPDEESATLEEHLLVCERCREQICHTDLYMLSMEEAAGDLRERPVMTRDNGWRLLKLLAVVAVVAVLALLGMMAARYY